MARALLFAALVLAVFAAMASVRQEEEGGREGREGGRRRG
jgi:hypothetical protein